MTQQGPCCDEWSPETEVIDSRTADRVCTMCGRVLEGFVSVEDMTTVTFFDGDITGDARTAGAAAYAENVPPNTVRESSTPAAVKRGAALLDEYGGRLQVSRQTVLCAQDLLRDSIRAEQGRCSTNIRTRAGACLYYGAKLDGCDRSETEVADAVGLNAKEMRRASKRLREVLAAEPYAPTMVCGVSASALIPRVLQATLAQLEADITTRQSARVRTLAEDMVAMVKDLSGAGEVKPMSLAAAAVALAIEDQGHAAEQASVAATAAACRWSATSIQRAAEELKKKWCGTRN